MKGIKIKRSFVCVCVCGNYREIYLLYIGLDNVCDGVNYGLSASWLRLLNKVFFSSVIEHVLVVNLLYFTSRWSSK